MEINQKTKITTVKNEYYQAMLSHLDNALQNWRSFSRLDRLEYAYKSLELARNYTCSARGADPSKITVALEIMPSMGYTHSVKTEDGSALVTTTLSVPLALSAFKVSPVSVLRAALHESTHACDEVLSIAQHFENAPMHKLGEEIFPSGYYHEIYENYKSFGIAWLGKPDEIRADEASFTTTLDLLQDLVANHPENSFYKTKADNFKADAEKQMAREYQAEVELDAWKAELYQKYLPEGQTSYPVVDETLQITDFEPPTNNFATIETIRSVADQNEQMFKTSGYVEAELQGATSNQAVEALPATVGETFKQTNATCVNQIGQSLTPTTTMNFITNSMPMEIAQ